MLPAKNRLKLPTTWQRNYSDSQLRTPHFKALIKKVADGECKVGFVISSKVGKATDRNRIRRLLETFLKDALTSKMSLEIVLIIYPSANKASNEELSSSINQILSKIHLQ